MNADHASLSHHPAPHRDRVSAIALLFGLLAGPLAWFAQLCAGYSMASWPCFPLQEHRTVPLNGYAWTWDAIVVVSILSVVIALAAFIVSRNIFRMTMQEGKGDHRHVLEVGTGRTRFLALWGMILGGGFAAATAMTTVAFFFLPRCAG
jgi:hypothetical protein